MRSFYCYVRTTNNEFFSCSVCAEDSSNLVLIAYRRFEELGNPLPTAGKIYSMRFLSDPRNLMDDAGYEEVGEADPPADDEKPEDSDQPPITPCH